MEFADPSSINFYYEKGVVDFLSPCPGRYCGRTHLSNGSWSGCGACERGTRRNASSACEPCSDVPKTYDWLYLGFMLLAPLVLHLLSVDYSVKKHKLEKFSFLIHGCVVIEVIISALITLLITPPLGYLTITSCNAREISDWYPILHNPNPNYEGQLHCTQEAVYPIYTMVLVAYSILLVTILTLRPLMSRLVTKLTMVSTNCIEAGAIYAALYLLPILTVIHALFAGVIYTIFPFLVIIGSVISVAAYIAHKEDQAMPELFLECIGHVRSVLILLGHWILHAYGIFALTQIHDPPQIHYAMCALVPLPTVFYILTARFSDPAMIPIIGVRPQTNIGRPTILGITGAGQ